MPNVGNINPTHPGQKINDSHVEAPLTRSKFPSMSYILASTQRFGELQPHYVADIVPSDNTPLNCVSKIRSFTLKAPLMQDVTAHRDYYYIPRTCLLPFQYDRVFVQPNLGDDVPDDAGTSVTGFYGKIRPFFEKLRNDIVDYSGNPQGFLSLLFPFLICGEYFFSNGSLLNTLGRTYANRFWCINPDDNSTLINYDTFFDRISSILSSNLKELQFVCNNHSYIYKSDVKTGQDIISFRTMLEVLRDNGGAIDSISFVSWPNFSTDYQTISNAYFDVASFASVPTEDKALDLARLFSYQIVCAHFYTNDSVDYIYSADLYRQNLQSLYRSYDIVNLTFEWNGIDAQYDYCSAHYFDTYLKMTSRFGAFDPLCDLFGLIFAFRRSLRFVDYFTGAKTRPIAVGDTDVVVNQDKVQVVDITRNIQRQRWFNAVNRAKRKVSEYFKAIFNVDMSYDYHDPMFLAATSDNTFTNETSNTGSDQLTEAQTVTSVFNMVSNKYAFSFDAEHYGVVIGITYFDIPRLYSQSSDRAFFAVNRYDHFQPFMQFIGDQPIYREEITDIVNPNAPGTFGYTTRHQEYKQRVSRAVGGFVDSLPGFAFIADHVPGVVNPTVINPDYIRSHNAELDEFYVSLTGFSLGHYFHFILWNNNQTDPSRDMYAKPQIL